MIIPAVKPVGALLQEGQSNIVLQPGHTYRAVVVGQEDRTVLLRIYGVLIRGESELSLPVGQVIYLQAESSQEHAMVLRLVQAHGGRAHTPDLSQALTQLGLTTNPVSTMVANTLLNWLLPLNPEQVRKLARELRDVPSEHREAFVTVKSWARAVGLEDGPLLKVVTRLLLGEAEPEEVPPAIGQINRSGHLPAYPEVRALWWEHPPHHGEMYVLRDKRGAVSGETTHLAVRIDTLHYGEVWVGFSYSGHRLHLCFHGEDEQFLARIEEKETLLTQAVAQSGLTLAGITCCQRRALSFLDVFPLASSPSYRGVSFLV